MRNSQIHLWLVLLGLCMMIAASGALARAAEPQGGTIRIVVPFPPGGIYDFWARVSARHLGRYLPGNPSVVVQNMPGGGGFIGTNFLYSVASRDGRTIGIAPAELTLAQLIEEPGVKYDAIRFNYLGTPTGASRVIWVRAALPHRTVQELRALKEPLVGGAIRRTSPTYTIPLFTSEGLGFPLKFVTGYPGMAPVMTALERGEVDVTAADFESPAVLPRWKAGVIRPIAYLGVPKKTLTEAGVPDILDLGLKGESEALLRLILPIEYAPFPFVAPPGVTGKRVALLQGAFDKLFRNPKFIAEAAKAGATVLPTSGPDLLKLQESILKAPADVVSRYKTVVAEP